MFGSLITILFDDFDFVNCTRIFIFFIYFFYLFFFIYLFLKSH